MKDLCELSWFLGIEFKCMENGIFINQTKYIEKLLSRFDMADCKPKTTPVIYQQTKSVMMIQLS